MLNNSGWAAQSSPQQQEQEYGFELMRPSTRCFPQTPELEKLCALPLGVVITPFATTPTVSIFFHVSILMTSTCFCC